MKFSIREWKPAHLLGAWVAYWVLLAGVTLGPGLLLLTRLRGDGVKGSASAHLDNAVFTATIDVGASQAWHLTAHLGTISGWLAGPPLVLWAVYMATRPSRNEFATIPAPALGATSRHGLDAGDADQVALARLREREREVERERVK